MLTTLLRQAASALRISQGYTRWDGPVYFEALENSREAFEAYCTAAKLDATTAMDNVVAFKL